MVQWLVKETNFFHEAQEIESSLILGISQKHECQLWRYNLLFKDILVKSG